MYAIKMLDLNYAENTRAAVELKNLTNQEFTLEMKTVHDTQMYGMGVTWMACPSVWYSWCVDTRIPQSLIPIIFHFNFLKLPDSFCHNSVLREFHLYWLWKTRVRRKLCSHVIYYFIFWFCLHKSTLWIKSFIIKMIACWFFFHNLSIDYRLELSLSDSEVPGTPRTIQRYCPGTFMSAAMQNLHRLFILNFKLCIET